MAARQVADTAAHTSHQRRGSSAKQQQRPPTPKSPDGGVTQEVRASLGKTSRDFSFVDFDCGPRRVNLFSDAHLELIRQIHLAGGEAN